MQSQKEARRSDGVRRRRPGALVRLRAGDLAVPLPGVDADTMLVCLNAARQGKGFVNHYLVPLDPPVGPAEALPLLYVDYNLPLEDVSDAYALEVTPLAEDRAAADVGQVVENANGRFLKTVEPYKDAFSLAYVDIATGAVRRRQDRGARAVLGWRLCRREDDDAAVASSPPAAVTTPDGPGPRLRAWARTDIPALSLLLAAEEPLPAEALARRLAPLADSSLAFGWVVEDAGAVIGGAVAVHDGLRAWVAHLVIHPDHRRRGLGRQLVAALADVAAAQGLSALQGIPDLEAAGFAAAAGFSPGAGVAVRRPTNPSSD